MIRLDVEAVVSLPANSNAKQIVLKACLRRGIKYPRLFLIYKQITEEFLFSDNSKNGLSSFVQ